MRGRKGMAWRRGAMLVMALTVAGLVACGESGGNGEAEGEPEGAGAAAPAAALESGGSGGALPIADTVQRLRGILVMGTELQVFRPCGSLEEGWVVNHSRTLTSRMRELGIEPFEEFYVEVKATVESPYEVGPSTEFDRLVKLTEIEAASADTLACDRPAGSADGY